MTGDQSPKSRAGTASAGPGDYSTPGWYRVIHWLDDDGETIIDEYIEGGPYADQNSCLASITSEDEDNRYTCEYYSEDPHL